MEIFLLFVMPFVLGAGLTALYLDVDEEEASDLADKYCPNTGSNTGDDTGTSVDANYPSHQNFPDALRLSSASTSYSGDASGNEIDGGLGDDTILGNEGDDLLWGANGQDNLSGGAGKDILFGGGNHDLLSGGTWDDILAGENGKDTIYGGDGNDQIHGGAWNDHAYGGAGFDTIMGEKGSDYIEGGNGKDVLTGNTFYAKELTDKDAASLRDDAAVDDLSDISGYGAFAMRDDFQDDTVVGGAWNDDLYLGEGDIGTGGTGQDTFRLHATSGNSDLSYITDYSAKDDSIVIMHTQTTAPAVTVTDDGSGNAQVKLDGEIVALVHGAGGTLNAGDIEFQQV